MVSAPALRSPAASRPHTMPAAPATTAPVAAARGLVRGMSRRLYLPPPQPRPPEAVPLPLPDLASHAQSIRRDRRQRPVVRFVVSGLTPRRLLSLGCSLIGEAMLL